MNANSHTHAYTPERGRRIVICVDDVGLNPAVTNAAILLFQKGVISAASILVESPHWQYEAPRLRDLPLDLGLHFNLTRDLGPLAQPATPLLKLGSQAWLRRLSGPALQDMMDRQLESFTRNARRLPDFVDSHDNVHQFPQIRKALFQTIERWWPGSMRPWVRVTWPLAGYTDSLSKVRAYLGGARFRLLTDVMGLPTNRSLAGLSRQKYTSGREYAQKCDHWLRLMRDGSLWAVHPATAPWAGDPFAAARQAEFAVLQSSSFIERMQQAKIQVCRGSDIYVRAQRAKILRSTRAA
jgi:predicted glycoside hydrolase/deacetylase ChbG (UPF0249 family)